MITVIIPALNEEKTIRKVIRQAKRNSMVSEIIVVDDRSTDHTVEEASKENVKILISTELGKGHSMREGMWVAKNKLLVYLDADIPNYASDIIDLLTGPLLRDEADFVKSYFERQAGRVTEILVKPLLEFFFPQLLKFKQPLSGMIAGKKSFFEKVEFENDYGVDIGLLIDMHQVQARICEVCIGEIENDMQPLHALGRMARQVAGAIFKRVNFFNSKKINEDNLYTKLVREELEYTTRLFTDQRRKLIVFDMDNTLLRGSFIQAAAAKFGFSAELLSIQEQGHTDRLRTKRIASLLKGRTLSELMAVAESIPLIGDAVQVISELHLRGYICGIISDSYHCVTNHIQNMLGLDFSLANELEFNRSMATGEVSIPAQLFNDSLSHCKHEQCKSNYFRHILDSFGISPSNAVAVGDGENDVCMMKLAGKGISFNSTYHALDMVADYTFKDQSLSPILKVAL